MKGGGGAGGGWGGLKDHQPSETLYRAWGCRLEDIDVSVLLAFTCLVQIS